MYFLTGFSNFDFVARIIMCYYFFKNVRRNETIIAGGCLFGKKPIQIDNGASPSMYRVEITCLSLSEKCY